MQKNRKIEYEKIRACAMLFTIGGHCIERIPRETAFRNDMYEGIMLLFYTCNSIFFMLSGKFALAAKCEVFEDYLRYYYKKFINLFIPVLGYMFLKSLYESSGVFWEADFWRAYVENVFYKYLDGEYWFLYALIGLSIVTPFFSKIVRDMGNKEMWLLIGIGMLHNSIRTYALYFDLKFYWQYLLGEWAFYFILGYCLEKVIDTPRKENIIILLGALSFCISMIQKQFGLVSFIHDLAPTFTMISCAVFFILKRYMPIKTKGMNRVIMALGKYSFAIYMVHYSILEFIADRMPLEGNYIVTLFVLMASTAAVSFAVAFVCENTFMRGLKLGVGKVVMVCRRRGRGSGGLD